MKEEPILSLITSEDLDFYLSSLPPDSQPVLRELYGLPPRFVPVVVGSMLDEHLTVLLAERLVEGEDSARLIERVNNRARIEWGVCLGLVPPELGKVLSEMATVRNHFAHSVNPRYSDKKPREAIKRLVRLLATSMGKDLGSTTQRIEMTIKQVTAEIDRSDDLGRLWYLSMYAILRMIFQSYSSHIARVDEVWRKSYRES